MRQLFSNTASSKVAARIVRLGLSVLCATVFFSAACAGGTSTGGAGEKKEMSKEEAANTLGTAAQIRLDEPRLSARLPLAASGPAADRLRRGLAAELVLDGVEVSQPPGVMFNVYLGVPGPNPRRQYVGTLSFFGVSHSSGHVALPGRTFDVTEQLQTLRGQSPQLSEVQVVFEATDGTAESTPEKVGALLNRQAGLRVGSVRLRVQGHRSRKILSRSPERFVLTLCAKVKATQFY